MHRAVKVVLWVLGTVTSLVLAGVGWLWWSFSGGWDGIRPVAQPEDREVVDAREAGHEPLSRLVDPLEAELGATGTSLGRADLDRCERGENNWKTTDGWTLSCAQATVLGAASAQTSTRTAATDVDTRLRALGWVPASFGEMDEHTTGGIAYGRYAHPDDPGVWLVVEVADPGSATPHVELGRSTAPWTEGDAQPVQDAVRASSAVTVLAVVERTYFQDG